MSLKAKKVAVLAKLQEANAAVSMPELMRLLGAGYSDRTVRRWLSQLIDDGLVIRIGKKRATKYQLVEHFETTDNKLATELREIVEGARTYLAQPLFERKPVAYNAQWLDEYNPNITNYMPSTVSQKLVDNGTRSQNIEPAGTYARHIYNRLLIDLSYNSSRLEGNTYSLLDTERLLLEGIQASGKLNEEMIMLLNHKEAIRYLVDNSEQLIIESNTIKTIHYLLADSLVPTQYAGKVRDHAVKIGGSSFMPLENAILIEKQLTTICEKAKLIANPFEQSLFLLVQLSYLQAFHDVNKRTARLACNIPLIKNNLVPLSFNDMKKNDYITAILAIYELNDLELIISLYSDSYLRTCSLYNATVEAMGFDAVRVKYRKQRRAIVKYIIEEKITGKDINTYVATAVKSVNELEPADKESFIQDIDDDLQNLSPQTIVGLGISVAQLEEWLRKSGRKPNGA